MSDPDFLQPPSRVASAGTIAFDAWPKETGRGDKNFHPKERANNDGLRDDLNMCNVWKLDFNGSLFLSNGIYIYK